MPVSIKCGSLLALASAAWPVVALGQRTSAPSLPVCTVLKVDATGWKELTSRIAPVTFRAPADFRWFDDPLTIDRKSTRLNSSHITISYAVFCLKKKKQNIITDTNHHII